MDNRNRFSSDDTSITLDTYLSTYKDRIQHDSEKLFVSDFLLPIFGDCIRDIVPQYSFLTSNGSNRYMDFALLLRSHKIGFEIDGESYHAEGAISSTQFDDSLFRQNELIRNNWKIYRFSYTQLQSPIWRLYVYNHLKEIYDEFYESQVNIEANFLQERALQSLSQSRKFGNKKGIVILPTGTGKTYLAAFDSLNTEGRILFIVHRLDILSQSLSAFKHFYNEEDIGLLTGEEKRNLESKVLFASKDSLVNLETLYSFKKDEFAYIIIDEVHHSMARTYQIIINYFEPTFYFLGLTATPDRMDRKDIFELFEYNKVFEYSLDEAITEGFIVPYIYYGLKDNIDYSNIRYNNNKYVVSDLNKYLIIPERNNKIIHEYIDKGKSAKAIGFCCSIKHSNAMAEFFTLNGIPSVSITSDTPDRDQQIELFRSGEYHVAFTVDLFNEGIDFPNVNVLLFLRPTESKTVFMQQLGRGLRLCDLKEKAIVLDFISNYRKANNIRKHLSKSKAEKKDQHGRTEKIEYIYNPKCDVFFDSEIETMLDEQDKLTAGISREDLIGAYYDLKETLERKPSRSEINEDGEYKIAKYMMEFGSWINFLKEIGELTESSYHFPQGVHLGHLFYILKTIALNEIANSHIDYKYITFDGHLTEGIDRYQRQTKYKLQAAMELNLIKDYRNPLVNLDFKLELSENGKKLWDYLKTLLEGLDWNFQGDLSWNMEIRNSINEELSGFLEQNPEVFNYTSRIFFDMDAVILMLKHIYHNEKTIVIKKSDLYQNFILFDDVVEYCDTQGIEVPSEEGIKHRAPFLLNVLEALGIIEQSRSTIEVKKLVLNPNLFDKYTNISEENNIDFCERLFETLKEQTNKITEDEITDIKLFYGRHFLEEDYIYNKLEIIYVK